jgi:hypothetical protein
VQDRIDEARALGYEVQLAFVETPPAVAADRAVHRWTAEGEEGRFVNVDQYEDLRVEQERDPDGFTTNRRVFETLKGKADGWVLVDSSTNPEVMDRQGS